MLLVWPKYIFLIKYTLINWNLSTDAKKNFQCVHSYIIFEIQKIRKKLILLFFIRFDLPQSFCCRLKWAGLWKYHYKPLPIQSLVCSWAVVVPKYRRREFLEFPAPAGAASKANWYWSICWDGISHCLLLSHASYVDESRASSFSKQGFNVWLITAALSSDNLLRLLNNWTDCDS